MEQERELEQLMAEALMRQGMPCPDVDGEWERLSKRLRKPRHGKYALWSALAAAAVLFVAIYIVWRVNGDAGDIIYEAKGQLREVVVSSELPARADARSGASLQGSEVKTIMVDVPQGTSHHVVLPDGSEVWLNAQSRLAYPERFADVRRVELEGEAYFSVRHDESHPFVVISGGVSTEVLGTEFNVNSYKPEAPSITLVEGKIKVSEASMADRVAVLDTPGQGASLSEEGTLQVGEVSLDDVLCWREGIVLFDDASLHDILVQMGSWYGMSVICKGNPNLSARYHYIYDRNEGAEQVVRGLRELSNVKIKIENNNIFVE